MDVPSVPGGRGKSGEGPAARPRGDRRADAARSAGRPAPRPGAGSFGKGLLMLSPDSLLSRIGAPEDLKKLSDKELEQLADEMRGELLDVVGRRAAHFAS